MRIGVWNGLLSVLLGLAISFVAKDLTVPLVGFALFGLFDRLVGARLNRAGNPA